MRRPGDEHLIGPEEKFARETSFYAIDAGKNPKILFKSLGVALAQPKRFLSSLGLAWRTAPPGFKGGIKQTLYLAEAMVLASHLKNLGIDHLHNHFADPSANVAMLTSALSGIPFSYTLHGPAELYEPEKWHLREKTARAKFVACISHFARSQAMYFSDPDHWHKLHIVHCGVIPEYYERPPPPKIDGMQLLFVGRLTAIKGLRILFEAFAEARKSHPDLALKLVGDGDDRAHLEKLAAPVGEAVQFAGFLSQDGVAEALAEADVLVLPSFAEGLPVVLMEALAAATPVICTQVAGVGELVEDGVSGFRVPAGDVQTLAEKIGQLADDPALRIRMGVAGREKTQTEFDIRLEATRIAALFSGHNDGRIRPEPYKV